MVRVQIQELVSILEKLATEYGFLKGTKIKLQIKTAKYKGLRESTYRYEYIVVEKKGKTKYLQAIDKSRNHGEVIRSLVKIVEEAAKIVEMFKNNEVYDVEIERLLEDIKDCC